LWRTHSCVPRRHSCRRLGAALLRYWYGQGLPKALVVDFIGSFLMALVLFHTIRWSGAQTVVEGLFIGFINWLGFVAVANVSTVTYERKPVKLYLLNNGYQLVSILAMGAILAVWA